MMIAQAPTYVRETAAQIAYRIRNRIPPPRPVFVSERVEAGA